jgi:hypothetical protein
MRRRAFFPSVLAFLLLAPLSAEGSIARDTAGMLARADSFRLPDDSMKYLVTIVTSDKDRETERDSFLVSSHGQRSLIEMLSAKSRGQQVLVLNRQMWIKMPKSKRVIRITPLQRLTGQASFSDLARLKFDADYRITASKDVLLGDRACVALDLRALAKDETYPAIALWVEAARGYPVKADFFLPSGKRFKSLDFEPPERIGDREVTTKYAIRDDLHPDQVSSLSVSEIRLTALPDSLFSISRLEGD